MSLLRAALRASWLPALRAKLVRPATGLLRMIDVALFTGSTVRLMALERTPSIGVLTADVRLRVRTGSALRRIDRALATVELLTFERSPTAIRPRSVALWSILLIVRLIGTSRLMRLTPLLSVLTSVRRVSLSEVLSELGRWTISGARVMRWLRHADEAIA